MRVEFCNLCHRYHEHAGCPDSRFMEEMHMLSVKARSGAQLPEKAPFTSDTVIDINEVPPGVKVTLTANHSLPPETVRALAEMIRVAVKQFSKQ